MGRRRDATSSWYSGQTDRSARGVARQRGSASKSGRRYLAINVQFLPVDLCGPYLHALSALPCAAPYWLIAIFAIEQLYCKITSSQLALELGVPQPRPVPQGEQPCEDQRQSTRAKGSSCLHPRECMRTDGHDQGCIIGNLAQANR